MLWLKITDNVHIHHSLKRWLCQLAITQVTQTMDKNCDSTHRTLTVQAVVKQAMSVQGKFSFNVFLCCTGH